MENFSVVCTPCGWQKCSKGLETGMRTARSLSHSHAVVKLLDKALLSR